MQIIHINVYHSILYLVFCRAIEINEEMDFNESWIVLFILCEIFYSENANANFKCPLRTFRQQLAFKIRAHCRISIVLLQTSLYCPIRDMVIVIWDAILCHDNIAFSKKVNTHLLPFPCIFCTIRSRGFLVGNIQMDAMQWHVNTRLLCLQMDILQRKLGLEKTIGPWFPTKTWDKETRSTSSPNK